MNGNQFITSHLINVDATMVGRNANASGCHGERLPGSVTASEQITPVMQPKRIKGLGLEMLFKETLESNSKVDHQIHKGFEDKASSTRRSENQVPGSVIIMIFRLLVIHCFNIIVTSTKNLKAVESKSDLQRRSNPSGEFDHPQSAGHSSMEWISDQMWTYVIATPALASSQQLTFLPEYFAVRKVFIQIFFGQCPANRFWLR
ncbi:hypothetical protein HPP92_003573 [Vanilla planifolia]|uniref:Uncharacterized protein n=1 Tax=Vanilla planifolia TaxID=51239 RepID=A0A835VNS3_VANPL|nr:hypothetical protein HPP92_003573 [Vanilla planifolia]